MTINRKLSSTEKALINKAARAATNTRFTLCEVGNKSLPGDRTTFNDAECIVLGGDLYDNANPLASFRLDFTNGLLDIYVYTYETIADLKEGDVELMTNLTVRIKDGKAIAAWEEGRATEAQMAMYEEVIAEVTRGRNMTDREKFDAWIKACPLSILGQNNYQDGYVEVLVNLPDEVDKL